MRQTARPSTSEYQKTRDWVDETVDMFLLLRVWKLGKASERRGMRGGSRGEKRRGDKGAHYFWVRTMDERRPLSL